MCGDVEEEVKRWSGGEKSGGAWAHGWHLGRVLKVGISGPAQRRQKCLPIDAAGEREGKTHAMWPEGLRQIRTPQERVWVVFGCLRDMNAVRE